MDALSANPHRLAVSLDEGARQRALADLLALLTAAIATHGRSAVPDYLTHMRAEPVGLRLMPPGGGEWFVGHGATPFARWVRWPGGEAYLPPASAYEVGPLVSALLQRLHGDEVEVCLARVGSRPIARHGTWVHAPGWWDDWASRPIDDVGTTVGDVYATAIHPNVERSLAVAPPGRVVDVCGGDGALGARLAARWPGLHVTSVDINPVMTAAAATRVHAVRADVRDPGWVGLGPFDAAVLCGAVTASVMTPDDARTTLANAVAAVRPGGVVVIAGFSPCLVEATDLVAAGLRVVNFTAPPTEDDPVTRQHYVTVR